MADYLRYTNQGATRNLPLSPRLVQALSYLPELGVTAEVFSGGQPKLGSGGPRVGSVRHDDGDAADVFFYRNGRRLDWANPDDLPVYEEIVRRGRAAGLTGFGAGPGYMGQGSMHLGFGSEAVWGDEGRSANAPEWLKAAYYGTSQGQAPSVMDKAQPQNALAQQMSPQDQLNMLALMAPPPMQSNALNAADFMAQPNALALRGFM